MPWRTAAVASLRSVMYYSSVYIFLLGMSGRLNVPKLSTLVNQFSRLDVQAFRNLFAFVIK
ncbi:hypothetical protein TUM4261_01610 [Shewanella sp. c952]|nr:hypothetical protein TUM4261_01610 [Shewanella sp. c952]